MSKTTFISPQVETDSIESLSLKLLQVTDELKKTNDELIKKNKELEESERLRKAMIANVSHDLRAPLTAIRSALSLLEVKDKQAKESLDGNNHNGNIPCELIEDTIRLIDRRVSNLEGLVQDLYFLATVSDTLRSLDMERVKLGPFLENYYFDAIVDSRYDNHDMQLDVPMDLNVYVNIDIQKTIRVLDNLFTNAAKYSGDGSSITLAASVDAISNNAVISVSDNGVGIPADSIPYIFNPTYTVSTARTPCVEAGSGLGLAIVKTVIEKENGTIECESAVGEGTRFIITLPII